jgi:hypothetical protein
MKYKIVARRIGGKPERVTRVIEVSTPPPNNAVVITDHWKHRDRVIRQGT